MQSVIHLFCRAPAVGRTKTRLVPALGAQGANDLHEKMLRHVLTTLLQDLPAPLCVHVAGDPAHVFFNPLRRYPDVILRHQPQGDLGQRMYSAICTAPQYDNHVLVGADAPALDVPYIQTALGHLESGTGAVLGPAEDGGYVLLGLRNPQPETIRPLFHDMPWGSDQVAAITRQRLADAGAHCIQLPTLWDVDHPADLPRLHRIQWQTLPPR